MKSLKKTSAFFKNIILEIEIFKLLTVIFYVFIFYAIVDVVWKVETHSKYNMEQLLKDIQKDYPKSKLTFQNILVIDNDLKISSGRSASRYFEKKSIYIRNGKLKIEPNFLTVLYLLPGFIFLITNSLDQKSFKLKDLSNLDRFSKAIIFGTLLFAPLIFNNTFKDNYEIGAWYKSPFKFNSEIENKKKSINVEKYRLRN